MRTLLKASNLTYIQDLLITVTPQDIVNGVNDKVVGHTASFLKTSVYPHRAFSLFMFDQQNKLVLQKRSHLKPAFPRVWSNTCCSHPLFYPECLNEPIESAIRNGKVFACKRTSEELGCKFKLMPEQLHFAGRYHYKAICDDHWGEHEMDYVYFTKINNPTFDINKEEIEDIALVGKDDYHKFVREKQLNNEKFSPWYLGISEHILEKAWNMAISNDLYKLSEQCLRELKIINL